VRIDLVHLDVARLQSLQVENVGGTYDLEDSQLSLALGPSPLIGCALDSQANAFVRDPRSVATLVFDGDATGMK
jgi:hypothetical protein